MRYTEHEYKLDHLFDYIRLFASFILGAFRLFAEIGNKIVYLRVKGETNTLTLLLKKSILLNAVALIASAAYGIFVSHYGVSHSNLIMGGTVPLLSFGFSLVILGIAFLVSTRLKQPALHKFNNTSTDTKHYEPEDIDDNSLEVETDIVEEKEPESVKEATDSTVDKKEDRTIGSMTDEEVKKQPELSSQAFAELFNKSKNIPVDSNFKVPPISAPSISDAEVPGQKYEVTPNNAPTTKPNPLLNRSATRNEIKDTASALTQDGNIANLRTKFGNTSEELRRQVEMRREQGDGFRPRLEAIESDDDDDMGEDYDD